MKKFENILVTGGAGFIGSHFIKVMLRDSSFKGKIINYDLLTYAGNLENLFEIRKQFPERYIFVQGDICNQKKVLDLFLNFNIDCIVHFAAESHVDRSISGPADFIQTNIQGTFSLLEATRAYREKNKDLHFHHISTDEVFGSLGADGLFSEESPYRPNSPYSASKASSDHLVRSYAHTYNLSYTLSNCSNNYGPFQFPEKLIPVVISKALDGEKIPVYGDGKNVRDWLYVEDHVRAVKMILEKAQSGQSYNIGGNEEWTNIDLVKLILRMVAELNGNSVENLYSLVEFVEDRPGHDKRYAIDSRKIRKELLWKPERDFENNIRFTIKWYLQNKVWIENIKSGKYRDFS